MMLIVALIATAAQVYATEKTDSNSPTGCPDKAVKTMDEQFGVGAADLTECLAIRRELKVVVAWNSADLYKSGIGLQVKNSENISANYETMYGLRAGTDYHLVIIGYGKGASWLLNDEAYNKTYGVTTGNPSRQTVEAMVNKGLALLMCQNTMKNNAWSTTDLLPGIKMVPSGVAAVLDYQARGYTYLNP